MKKTTLLLLATLCAFLLSGCSLMLEDPSTLIFPPAKDPDQYVERRLINLVLTNDEHLQVPDEMEDPAAYIRVDVNGDGKNEKLVFWSKNNGYEVGALIMQESSDGNWEVLDQVHQYGSAIDYFKMVDVDGDGTREACMGVNIGGYNVLYIYKLSEDGFTPVEQIDYSQLNIVESSEDDKDNIILTALNDINATTPTTTVYAYLCNKNLEQIYKEKFDGNCVELKFGEVGKNKKGLYVVRSSDYTNFNVDLLLPSKEKGFEDQLTERIYSVDASGDYNAIIEDVTGDGILDVQSMLRPIDSTKRDSGDFIKIWKSWDGKDKLSNVYGILENNTDGYIYVLPTYSLSTVRYQFITEKSNSQVRFFDGNAEEPAVILYTHTASSAERLKKKEGLISLGSSPSQQRVYYALRNSDEFAGHKISDNTIKEAFQIEGGS
ncbi:MAG: hypothetical protein Q4C56_03255 [Peptococcaceae bacterium]|nr:hypothetical protein [Peptococcaceae bacterium]